MKKLYKKILLGGVASTLLGGVLFLVGCGANGFSFDFLSNVQIEQKEYTEEVGKNITELSLAFETTDVTVNFDETAQGVHVSYPQRQNKKGENISEVTVTKTENSLTITEKLLPHLSIFDMNDKKLTVTLPTSKAYALSFEGDTGDVTVNAGGSFSNLTVKISTGDISLSNVQAEQLSATLSTGDIKVDGATVVGDFTAKATTGDTTLSSITASSLSVKASTGDVKINGASVTDAVSVETSTGDITFTGSVKAETVTVVTDTGDVKASDAVIDATTLSFTTSTGDVVATLTCTKHDYATSITTSTGDTNISSNLENVQEGLINPTRTLKAKTSTGDIKIYFAN